MTTETTVTCPQCNGRPHGTALACGPGGSKWVPTVCRFCAGSATVTEARRAAWQEREDAHDARVARRESMRDAAARLGMTTREYSAWENAQNV